MSTHLAIQTTIDYGRIFPADELAEAQYYQTTRRTHYASPELRLMAAVLEDAVATLTTDQRRCSRRQRREFADALAWLHNRSGLDWVLSFDCVCESLAIDPDYLRQGLLRKIDQVRDNKINLVPRRGRHFSPRRKTVRLRAG